MLSLLRELKAEEAGRLINELAELVRKVHTGSVLIGEHGKPQMPADLSGFVARVLDSTDTALLLKARMMIEEISEASGDGVLALLESRPELVREMIAVTLRRKARAFRGLRRKIDLVQHAMSDSEVAGEISKGIAQVDAQELAGTISGLLAVLNRAGAASPGRLRETISQVVDSLDKDEVRDAAQRVAGDLAAALRPLSAEVMPPLVKGLALLLKPEPGQRGAEMREALSSLREALDGAGGPA
jgi:hypothetical protein